MESQSAVLLQATILVVVLGGLFFGIGLYLASALWRFGHLRFEKVSDENEELRDAIAAMRNELEEGGYNHG
ncbi:MAG: hypothetical protein AAF514_10865 [Verrucomicrobiota bacterium]